MPGHPAERKSTSPVGTYARPASDDSDFVFDPEGSLHTIKVGVAPSPRGIAHLNVAREVGIGDLAAPRIGSSGPGCTVYQSRRAIRDSLDPLRPCPLIRNTDEPLRGSSPCSHGSPPACAWAQSVEVVVPLLQPVASLSLVSVLVVDANNAANGVSQNSLGHCARTPESRNAGTHRAPKVVRCPCIDRR